MILINRTFEIVTEESAANGEAAGSGFLAEGESVTFRELVALLRHGEPSQSPVTDPARCWVTHDEGETRAFFEDGERESHSTHYARENPARNLKYWRAALRAAGYRGA